MECCIRPVHLAAGAARLRQELIAFEAQLRLNGYAVSASVALAGGRHLTYGRQNASFCLLVDDIWLPSHPYPVMLEAAGVLESLWEACVEAMRADLERVEKATQAVRVLTSKLEDTR